MNAIAEKLRQAYHNDLTDVPILLDGADEIDRLREALTEKSLPLDRDTLGRMVREAWVRWALTQPDPKPSWLLPYDKLSEPDKEADRQIGEAIAKWTVIHYEANISLENDRLREAIQQAIDHINEDRNELATVARLLTMLKIALAKEAGK